MASSTKTGDPSQSTTAFPPYASFGGTPAQEGNRQDHRDTSTAPDVSMSVSDATLCLLRNALMFGPVCFAIPKVVACRSRPWYNINAHATPLSHCKTLFRHRVRPHPVPG